MKFVRYIVIVLLFNGCFSIHKIKKDTKSKTQDTGNVIGEIDSSFYQPSETRIMDLLHTRLELSFDWTKRYVNGKAELRLKPYFKPVTGFLLDAKGMNIHTVALLKGKDWIDLNYEYDKLQIKINLPNKYNRTDTLDILIKYTAKTYELDVSGSEAIREDRGLYFINHNGEEKGKPRQIWSQGETESNSCWFPTIDCPNEKMTQEIYLTVNDSLETLSNGLLIYSTLNGDGSRTDYWKQSLPHSPYLTMIAVGDYAVVKEEWHGKEVSYYVEHSYKDHVKMIFGNTPEMLEFYSTILGVPYSWEKYSQVVVRDFVSGAMENTSATLILENIQQNEREYLDNNYEEFIAHELFHQWFGDLVTCESWSNLPLNESFATYGEYLWQEHKFGLDEAHYRLQEGLNKYLSESRFKQNKLIRYYYTDREDMFDAHSYEKGGCILNYLRNYLGDEIFFASLKLYLTKYRFKTAEIHDLRMCFEEVSGEDLNWFFDQWFFNAGHPKLNVTIDYNDSLKKISVRVEQTQDLQLSQIYKLPLAIDIYYNGNLEQHNIIVEKVYQNFEFPSPQKPDWVDFDADKVLVGTKNIEKPKEQWIKQFKEGKYYITRFESLDKLYDLRSHRDIQQLFEEAMNDDFWDIRSFAIKGIDVKYDTSGMIKKKLIEISIKDPKSEVRANAISKLNEYNEKELVFVFEKSIINDPSYLVIGESLNALSRISPEKGKENAEKLSKETSTMLQKKIAQIYMEFGDASHNKYLNEVLNNPKIHGKYGLIMDYGNYLARLDIKDVDEGINLLEYLAKTGANWLNRYAATQSIIEITNVYKLNEKNFGKPEKASQNSKELAIDIVKLRNKISELEKIVASIKKEEKDESLIKIYNSDIDLSDVFE